jgi:hypothetical protein
MDEFLWDYTRVVATSTVLAVPNVRFETGWFQFRSRRGGLTSTVSGRFPEPFLGTGRISVFGVEREKNISQWELYLRGTIYP